MSTEADFYQFDESYDPKQYGNNHIYWYKDGDSKFGNAGLKIGRFIAVSVHPVTSNADIMHGGFHWSTDEVGNLSWGIGVTVNNPLNAPLLLRFNVVSIPTC